ncbi:MAG: cation diffusion facilitator family transporter [Bdellovibrionales bacterium]|nr:cation diffusion facilitator family transporter [Bdellovibrionales bacterium]
MTGLHHHHHDHDHSHAEEQPVRALRKALLVTGCFLVVEFLGGWISNSLALISDAGHMLIDVGGLLLSLFAAWIARRPPNQTMSFGYHRAEILGALASGLSIWALAGVLVFEAVHRLQTPVEVSGPIVLWIAAVGLLVNLYSLRVLHHDKEHSLNVRGAYLHVAADAFGSVGALVAGALITWFHWYWADVVMTFLLAGLMLFGSWTLIRDSVAILMESTPRAVNTLQLKAALQGLPGVSEVHDLHVWSVGSRRLAMSVHLVSERNESLLDAAQTLVEREFGIRHTTIQVENPERFRSERCYDCS